MSGERFGSYELLSLLGRGGMGEVYRAIDTEKNRGVVALKRLPAGLAGDSDFQRRFLREAELAATLRDPHVIPIHGYGEIDGQPYLDMRLVEGIDLATDLERHGPPPLEMTVAMLEQVAGALDAAHLEGLVHRDVKPSNVLLHRAQGTERPTSGGAEFVYLIDFGIAANLLSSRRSSSVVSGTAGYMAPERFTGGGDHRVDVYALGCLLHEMLTAAPPFAGDFMELMWAHVNQPPPRPSRTLAGLPAGLDDVVATAMAKDPGDRYSSAGALASAARHAVLDPAPSRPPRQAEIPTAGPGPARPVPPPPSAPGGGPDVRAGRTSTLAVFSLVFAIVLAPVGAVLGVLARRRIRRTDEGGYGLATAGVAIGLTVTVLAAAAFIAGPTVWRELRPDIPVQLEATGPDRGSIQYSITDEGQREGSSPIAVRPVRFPYQMTVLLRPGASVNFIAFYPEDDVTTDQMLTYMSYDYGCRIVRDGVVLDEKDVGNTAGCYATLP